MLSLSPYLTIILLTAIYNKPAGERLFQSLMFRTGTKEDSRKKVSSEFRFECTQQKDPCKVLLYCFAQNCRIYRLVLNLQYCHLSHTIIVGKLFWLESFVLSKKFIQNALPSQKGSQNSIQWAVFLSPEIGLNSVSTSDSFKYDLTELKLECVNNWWTVLTDNDLTPSLKKYEKILKEGNQFGWRNSSKVWQVGDRDIYIYIYSQATRRWCSVWQINSKELWKRP